MIYLCPHEQMHTSDELVSPGCSCSVLACTNKSLIKCDNGIIIHEINDRITQT